jgi:hypothetical protein
LKKSDIFFLVAALILAAVAGGVIGSIVGEFLPEGAVKTLFTKSYDIGFETISLKFYAISFTIGLMIKINFVSVLMMILVVIYFRWWYI